MTLTAYHNNPDLKARFLTVLQWHAEQDAIVKGTYGEMQNGQWQGCAVGCSIRSFNLMNGTHIDTSDHAAYETVIGVPEWLARLEDTIFEGLPAELAKQWPARFAEAIPVGADLEPVRWQFCSFLLIENLDRVLTLDIPDHQLKEQVVSAIRQVLDLGPNPTDTARLAEAARAAAWSAEAWSVAAWSAKAAQAAAWSAKVAEAAARAAAWSAEAWSAEAWSAEAAEAAAYQRYANHLVCLLQGAAEV